MGKKLVNSILGKGIRAMGYAMSGGDVVVMKGGSSSDESAMVIQKEQSGVLSEALLRGEVTQEVKSLMYRTYKIDEEMGDYKTIGSVGIKLPKHKPLVEEIEEGVNVIAIQKIKGVTTGIVDALDGNLYNATYKTDYFLTIKRDFTPRFLIEKYATQIVVKTIGDAYQLDIYVPKPVDKKEFDAEYSILTYEDAKIHLFSNEVEKIYRGDVRNDLVDFKELSFRGSNAFGITDTSLCSFKINKFITCTDFTYYDKLKECSVDSGSYILKFDVTPIEFGKKLSDEFYDKTISDKYENNERRESGKTLDLSQHFDPNIGLLDAIGNTIACERCGRAIGFVYKLTEDDSRVCDDRGVILEIDSLTGKVVGPMFEPLGYGDFKISKYDFGVGLCSVCLHQHFNFSKKDSEIFENHGVVEKDDNGLH